MIPAWGMQRQREGESEGEMKKWGCLVENAELDLDLRNVWTEGSTCCVETGAPETSRAVERRAETPGGPAPDATLTQEHPTERLLVDMTMNMIA